MATDHDGKQLPLDAPAPGDRLAGKYRIDAVIGRGGMSVVFRATHLDLEQRVAIKVLSPAALGMPEYVTRLKREARAASCIRSDHVVRVFDIGTLPGTGVPYLVMELLEGEDLAAVLARRGSMPVDVACECILQVCEALADAHSIGIVHRDLKPANLFLTESASGEPCVKVLDFGISRTMTRDHHSPLTDPGTVLGTPAYMAPEQMEGREPLDGRVDIWALGTILYELLAGRPRFSGDSLPQIFMSILRSPTPRPSRLRPDVPAAIDTVVARCLAVDPLARYATVAELAEALADIAPHGRAAAERIARIVGRRIAPAQSVVRPRPRARRARFGVAAALSVAIGAAVGFSVVSEGAPSAEGSVVEVTAAPMSGRVLLPVSTGVPDAGELAIVPEAVPVTVTAPGR